MSRGHLVTYVLSTGNAKSGARAIRSSTTSHRRYLCDLLVQDVLFGAQRTLSLIV